MLERQGKRVVGRKRQKNPLSKRTWEGNFNSYQKAELMVSWFRGDISTGLESSFPKNYLVIWELKMPLS